MNKRFNKYLLLLFGFVTLSGYSQDEASISISDSLYREDQFYLGITYNLSTLVPSGVNELGISGGLQLGYLRDMPINERRNVAVGIGAGLSIDQYGQNLLIEKGPTGESIFTVIEDTDLVSYNRLSTIVLEAPLEFRWRGSTPSIYKFWRVYSGIRFGYVISHKASFKDANTRIKITDIPELNKFRMVATLGVGYSTFNFHVQYGINPMFSDSAMTDTGEQVGFFPLKLGFILYIL
jgi:hypothetical protein